MFEDPEPITLPNKSRFLELQFQELQFAGEKTTSQVQ